MKNSFLYENNQQCDFQVNYDDYHQQIVTPTFAPDISRLTIRQFNDLYPRSSFLEYEQPPYHEQQPYSKGPPQPSYILFGSQQQHAPSQQVATINGLSYKEVVLLMDGLREKLDTIDERLRADMEMIKYCMT